MTDAPKHTPGSRGPRTVRRGTWRHAASSILVDGVREIDWVSVESYATHQEALSAARAAIAKAQP